MIRVISAAGCLLAAACATSGPTQLGPHTPTALTEVQAHLVIEQRLLARADVLSKDQGATLEGVGATDVDFVFGEPARGVEWLSTADRKARPQAQWPDPSDDGTLRVLRGTLDNGDALQVLLLDERAYLYEANSRWVQRGTPGIDTLEDALATDVQAFLDFVASEDAPLTAP